MPTIPLDANTVETYNPYHAPAASFGVAAKATDGNPLTSWTFVLDPSTNGVTKTGLVIDLKTPQALSALTLTTGSPGMTVEFYGASGALPTKVTDPAWVHLGSRPNIASQTTVTVDSQGRKFDHLLVWITHAPPQVNAGQLSISELSLAN